METNNEIPNFDSLMKTISQDRNYWLVRTMGGDYYREYTVRGYIAIGYNEVTLDDISKISKTGDKAQKLLSERIEFLQSEADDEVEIGNKTYAASMLLRFYREMKIGDVVIVPGRGSDKLTIGYIDSDVYTQENISKDDFACQFQKRRKVEWFGNFKRGQLNPRLQLMFSSRHVVSNINAYSDYIDALTNDFYEKDGKTHLILRVKSEENISANDFKAILNILDILDEFLEENKSKFSSKDIDIKLSVESPGDISLITGIPLLAILAGFIIIFVNGGTFSIKNLTVDIFAKGIIESLGDYLDKRRERILKKQIGEKLKNMEINDPKDLIALIKQTKNKRKEY